MDIKKMWLIVALSLVAFIPPERTIKVWLIGDSTMSDKELKAYPETGWGMPFAHFFDSTVVVDNRAKNGRSTKSFIAEGRWDAALRDMKAGDWVFIQFGHNDEVPSKGSYTPEDQFAANLVRFVKDVRGVGATAVLITPVARRKFDSSGTIVETHAVYAGIVRKVAAELGVALIDLDKESQVLLQQLGPVNSKFLFDYLVPGEHPNYPQGREDDTHFNELGARKMAEIVLADVRALKLDLAARIVVGQQAQPGQAVQQVQPGQAAPQAARIEPGPFADNAGHWYAIFNKENIINPRPGRPRYQPTELAAIADNILLFQKSNGGWPKNYDVFAVLTQAQKDSVAAVRDATNTTFDNGSTYNQIMALATAWYALKDGVGTRAGLYRAAAVRGLEFILRAQYANGGWPQYYPLQDDYSRHITFNDGAYEGIMRLLQAIADHQPQYDFVDDKLRARLAAAFDRGLDCILKLQIRDGAVATAWCQQYDEVTMEPAWARKFEPPSICNKESADLVLFLMTLDRPSPRLVAAIRDAAEWFKASRIYDTRVKTIPAERMVTPFRVSVSDRVAVVDSTAPPIWTRYYELGTHRPLFCNRDSKVVYSLAEVLRERRDGYGWYTYSPQQVIDQFPSWYARWSGGKAITVAADGSGDFATVQGAFDACVSGSVIFIKPGVYREKLHLDNTKNHITVIGDDAVTTVLTFDDHPGMVAPNGDSINTRNSFSVRIDADDVVMRDISIRNDAGFTAGQAVGLEARGDRLVVSQCRIVGNQDILFLNSETSRQYYYDCYIEGTTDFIFGAATAWFEQCHIHSKKNSHVTAASTPEGHVYGFVFDSCRLTGEPMLDRVSLGRPWRPYACVIYLHCWLDHHILSEGWSNWNKTDNYKTARYSEYDSRGPGANVSSRVSWSHQLTAAEAAKITVSEVLGGWNPLSLNNK